MNKVYRNVWNPATGTWCAVAENTKRRGKGAQLAGGVAVALGALGAVDAWAAAEPATPGVGGLELCQNSTTGVAYGITGAGLNGRPIPLDCSPGGGKVSFSLNNAANNAGGYGLASSTARITGYTTGVLELRGTSGISMLNDVLMNGNGITQLKAGQVSADSTDAVTGSQLYTVSTAVDKNAAGIAANLQSIGDLAAGKLGLVQQAGPGQKITVGAGTDGKSVDLSNNIGATRTLTGITAGVLSGDSTDAVNGKQLFTTNQNVSTNTTNISNLTQTTQNLVSGRAGLVQQLGAGQKITVGAGTDGTLVDLANNGGGARTLTSVAVGELSASSTDAVNGSQLFATNRNVANNAAGIDKNGQAITNLDGRVTTNENNITNLGNTINELSSGTAGLVQQAAPGANLTVGAGTDGAAVDFTNKDGGERKLTGIASGDLSAGSTDAVTGAQLNATNDNVATNAGNIAGLGDRVGATETRITNVDQSVQNIVTGKAGLVQQAGPGQKLTVGAGTDGTSIDLANNAGMTRTMTGVTAADLSASSTEAVNGSQLYDTNQNVATNAAGIDKNSQAIAGLDGRVGTNETNITNLGNTINELSSGTAGLVQQAAPGANLTVGSGTDGTAVDFMNKDGGERKLTGIASGDLSAGSTDAVTGAQLNTTNTNVGRNTDDIANLDGRVGSTETQITNIDQSVQNLTTGKAGLVQQAGPGAGLTVGAATDGTSVDFTNNAGVMRTLSGVANGSLAADSSDAVNGAQLFATNENVATNAAGIDKNAQAISGLDGRVGANETNITNLGNTINELSTGAAGMVQQAAPGANLTVGASTDGAAVDFTNQDGGERKLTGIASGDLSAGSTDAVTGAQLNTTNTNVTKNTDDIAHLDGRVGSTETQITNIDQSVQNLTAGKAGLVQQAGPGAGLTVGAATDGASVDFTNNAGVTRTLTGVANGNLAANSSDAVNGAQLFATNQNVATNADDIDKNSQAIAGLDGRVGTNETNITNLGNTINELSSGTAGLVQQAAPGANLTVGAGTDGAAVDFTNKDGGERKLTGIASGDLSAGSTDAVTGAQLNTTNTNVGRNTDDIANLDGRVGSTETQITNIDQSVQNLTTGKVGLVQQAGPGAGLTVGAATDGTSVDFTNNAGVTRTLSGVANGNLAANSSDAVNGAQLFATNQNVATNAAGIDKNSQAIDGLDGRVSTNETSITNLNNTVDGISSGTVGLVQQAAPGANLTVGAATDGAAVDFTSKAGASRTLTGVEAGNLTANSSDAVNGSQLFTTNQNVAGNTTSITNLNQTVQGLSTGKAGLVQQAAPGADLTVGAETDGNAVVFTNSSGVKRQLTGIATGEVAANSTDAVVGSQLYATNQDVAKNVSAIGELDGRVTTNRTDISNLSTVLNGLQTGTTGIVQQASATSVITVGKSSGGSVVDFAGTGGARRLTGVANGIDDHDAVTMAQLKAYDNVMAGTLSGMVSYDDSSYASVTLKGQGGTKLSNLAAGNVAEGSMDAINGSQLYVLQQQFGDLSKKYAMWQNQGGGNTPLSWAGTGAASTAVGTGAQASGSNTTAVGYGASATAENSTAIGQGSSATGVNSVALGTGSVALRDNSVSVGGPGSERQITNVAAGTAPTDAVNVQQMQSSSDHARRDAYSGVAAAMAVAGLPQSTQQGRTLVAAGGGVYASRSAFALGVSYMSRDSRWVVKGAASSSDNGQFGGAASVGYYF